MVLIVKYVFSSVVALVTHMFLLPLLLIFLLVFGLCVFNVVVVLLSRVGGGGVWFVRVLISLYRC